MYYILHKDRNLVGVSTIEESTVLGLEGVSIITVDAVVPDLNNVVWNGETLSLDTVTKTTFTPLEFLNLFIVQERIAINTSVDPIVVDIMKLFDAAENIDTAYPQTRQAIEYLSYIGILTSQRAMEILNA